MCRHFFLLLFSLVLSFSSFAQTDRIAVNEVILLGNDKTKDKVIFRELSMLPGDSITVTEIDDLFLRNRLQILGTGLFNNVVLNLKNYNPAKAQTDIEIRVEENWYLFPVPIFELADRNFSVWWQEQGRRLDRANYGFRIGHYNFTGNRDPLKLKIHFGYTRKYELEYAYPYLAWDNKLGIAGSIFYSENREIAYKTEGNKTLFQKLPDERKMLSRFRVGPQLKFRPTLNSYHSLRIEYHHNKIDDHVADYDNLSIGLGFEVHHSLTPSVILSTRNKGKTNINRAVVAFANNTGLGWSSDIVSGYELYVIDGTDYAISMNDAKWRFFDNNLNTVKWMPKQFRKMNLTLFLRANFDFAYVNERTYVATNDLSNKWIYGGGPALDIILFNNFLFSFEYSFNDLPFNTIIYLV